MKKLSIMLLMLFLVSSCNIGIESGRVYDKRYVPSKHKHYTDSSGDKPIRKYKVIPACYKLYVSDVSNPEKIGYKCVTKSVFNNTEVGDVVTKNIKRGLY